MHDGGFDVLYWNHSIEGKLCRGDGPIIDIDPASMLGKGLHRECYAHPENKDLCIKVVVAGGAAEIRREAKYYSHLQRRCISWEMLPQFYGFTETNLGQGGIFDLIRDDDGAISKSLEYYLDSHAETASHCVGLTKAYGLLKGYLYQHRIITMTIKPKNILFRKINHDDGRLMIVDNIGNSDVIPVCNYNTYLARKKISRKLRRFENALLVTYSQNKALHRIVNSAL